MRHPNFFPRFLRSIAAWGPAAIRGIAVPRFQLEWQMVQRLAGKTALITAAGQGIGYAAAE
ncbi:hypothetical protein ACLFKT_44160, partial [Paraburkholderia sp. BR14261]